MIKERANGLYGPTAFLIANIIIGIPFLCASLPPPIPSLTRLFCPSWDTPSLHSIRDSPSLGPSRLTPFPHLCSIFPSPNFLTLSPHLPPLLPRNLLANQPPLRSNPLLQLPPNPVPRSPCRGIPRRPDILFISYFRRLTCAYRVREWTLDDGGGVPRYSDGT